MLALFTVGVSNAQTADAIAKKYVEAIGGAATWKALKSQKLNVTLNQGGVQIPGYIVNDQKDRQRLELEFQGNKIINAYDGTTAWQVNPFAGISNPTKIEGDQAKGMTESKFLSEYIDYKKRGYELNYEGEEDFEGKSCHKIKMTLPSGTVKYHYFDKDSGLRMGEQQTTSGQTVTGVYSDYKEFEGRMIATKITQKVGGATQFFLTVNSVEFNPEVKDEMFAFPGN